MELVVAVCGSVFVLPKEDFEQGVESGWVG
jgi:hypothetical protein